MQDLVKNLEGCTSTDEINNLQSVQIIQKFFKYHHSILMNNSNRETYYHMKIISENIPQQHRHCTWTTNSAKGKANSQIHNQSQNTSPPNSVMLLLQDYNNKIDTLLRKYERCNLTKHRRDCTSESKDIFTGLDSNIMQKIHATIPEGDQQPIKWNLKL